MILWFTNPLIILHIIIGESHEDVRVLMGATNDGKNSTKIQKQLMDLKEQGGEDISGGAYDSMSTWHPDPQWISINYRHTFLISHAPHIVHCHSPSHYE